jgi:hypothetical protein
MTGKEAPNFDLLHNLSCASLSDISNTPQQDLQDMIQSLKEMKRQPADMDEQVRSAYTQYVTDMLPFYLDLLTLYLEKLVRLSEYTIEDIDVFY